MVARNTYGAGTKERAAKRTEQRLCCDCRAPVSSRKKRCWDCENKVAADRKRRREDKTP